MRSWPPLIFLLGCTLISGCRPYSPPGYREQNLPVSAEALKPYPALLSVDRQKMGFPPLPTNGTVRILTVDRARWNLEYPPPDTHDVSFQIHEGSDFYPYWNRFIALKKTNGGFSLVSEQLTYNGPKRYEVDGTIMNESISLVNETEQIAFVGMSITGTVITYRGPDRRFGNGREDFNGLTPSDVGPVLREWGYDYFVDKAGPQR